jgi:probable blue pigment (indigoidine) exporter
MKVRVVFLLLCCIWGSTWMFIKLGLRDLPPLSFAAARFLLATLVLSGIVAARRSRLPRGREWLLLAQTGVLSFGRPSRSSGCCWRTRTCRASA